MSRTGVTTYDLLISCPSDITNEIEIIKEVVTNFNTSLGEANNIQLITKHWSKNSYPESGGTPQNLLNKQFIFNCDVAIAVFGTRFGTPTDTYGSGTEEEIEELIKNGKQVFLYFCDAPVPPSNIEPEQYEKVNEFKKRYRNKGIYSQYTDLVQFKTDLQNHLTLYFLKLLEKPNSIIFRQDTPQLVLQGVLYGKPLSNFFVQKKECPLTKIEDIKVTIETLFGETNNIHLPKYPTQKLKEITETTNESLKFLNPKPVSIDSDIIFTIKTYANKNNISLSEDFFYLAELQKSINLEALLNGTHNPSLHGTICEKQKLKNICLLEQLIIEYNQLAHYYSQLSKISYVEFCVSNLGTSFDEDIDIQLKIPKNCYCFSNKFPIPEDDIIDQFDNDKINLVFKPKSNASISEYSNYPTENSSIYPYYQPSYPNFSQVSQNNQYIIDTAKENYTEYITELFCYKIFSDKDYDILCFKIDYLKHSDNMFIPTYICFNSIPDKILYEIKSKHSPYKVDGNLEFKEK